MEEPGSAPEQPGCRSGSWDVPLEVVGRGERWV